MRRNNNSNTRNRIPQTDHVKSEGLEPSLGLCVFLKLGSKLGTSFVDMDATWSVIFLLLFLRRLVFFACFVLLLFCNLTDEHPAVSCVS